MSDATQGRRSPWKAAVWSVLTLTVYGFWWWWEVNREVRARGRDVDPWRSLAEVTFGWLGVVFPFRSVLRTTAAIGELQEASGQGHTARPDVAVWLAAVAAVGMVGFFFSVWIPAFFFVFGGLPIAFGMAFVWYVQRELNRALASVATAAGTERAAA
jgi:hypothetical protein